MLGLSMTEIVIILGLALLLLGPDQLPSIAKTLGKGMREIRKATDDLKSTFDQEMVRLDDDEPQRMLQPVAGGEGPEDDVHLTLREHLLELRKRLKWAVLFLGLGFVASYHWSIPIFHFLMVPVLKALPEGEKALHFSSSVEPFFIYLKVGLYAGLFLALPAILWQLWAFVAPGLYRRERKTILPFVAAATLFFLAGAAFCYGAILG